MGKVDVIYRTQRLAFETLNNQSTKFGKQSLKVDPKSVTEPATLIQELPLTSLTNLLTFHFGVKSPGPTAALNNFQIGENDIAVVYGIQLLIGQGPTVANRIYRSFGPSVQDNAPYNGEMKMILESNIAVTKIDTLQFRKENGTARDQEDGLLIINPLRVITGRVSTFDIQVIMPDVSTTVFTPNLFVSCRLWVALGQAQM
jgi:hypothetical protein